MAKAAKSKVTKHQTFTARTISRALIQNAPYNPRIIGDDARKRLKKKLKKTGLVEPLIWNETTGNLVGGHQRLSVLDEIEGRSDYELTVAAVRLPEAKEKSLNVFLNNPAAMGEWDEERLAEIVKEFGDAPDGLGFDAADFDVIFENGELGGLFDDKNEGGAADIEAIKKMKDARKEHVEKSDATEGGDHYAVLVFPSKAVRDAFLRWCGMEPGQRFFEGAAMTAALGKVMRDG
ncbi:hypothetical protein [Geminisphaera colitermitum]|uniref:hypothetical protein n=1 Tax=Geminisphaera colitermitum TaxID=1148786 RepID=UPI000158D0FF|nr:hypothetical protein [Geminisphaera colitermitum]